MRYTDKKQPIKTTILYSQCANRILKKLWKEKGIKSLLKDTTDRDTNFSSLELKYAYFTSKQIFLINIIYSFQNFLRSKSHRNKSYLWINSFFCSLNKCLLEACLVDQSTQQGYSSEHEKSALLNQETENRWRDKNIIWGGAKFSKEKQRRVTDEVAGGWKEAT